MKSNFIKKIIVLTLCVLTVVAASCATACAVGKCSQHQWGDWVVTLDKTCFTDGERMHTCSVCNEVVTEVIPKSHDCGEWIEKVEATCTADGIKGHFSCVDCGKYIDEQGEEIYLLEIKGGHELTEVAGYEKTCTTDGLLSHKHCCKCNKNYDLEGNELSVVEIPADHEWGELVEKVDKTCVAWGMQAHYYCADCDTYFTEDKEITTRNALKIAKGHTLVDVPAIDKTCTTDGNIAHQRCIECDKIFNAIGIQIFNVTLKAGHEWGELIPQQDKTCEANGMREHYYCAECESYFDKNKKEKSIADLTIPMGHSLVSVGEKEKTCTEDGRIEHEHCEDCGKNFNGSDEEMVELGSVIVPASHNLVPIDYEEESCTVSGTLAHEHCFDCGKNFDSDGTELDSVTIPANHKISETAVERAEATCEQDGMQEHYTCRGCSAKFVLEGGEYIEKSEQELIIKASHSHYLVEEKASTCTVAGTAEHYACENCSKKFIYDQENQVYEQIFEQDLELKLSNHDYQFVAKEESSCDENGMEEHYECSADGCGKLFIYDGETETYEQVGADDLVIEASHSLQDVESKEATCEEDGYSAHKACIKCDYTEGKEEIPAKHSYEFVEGEEATAEQDGMKEHYECNGCDKVFIYDETTEQYIETTVEDLVIPYEHSQEPEEENE